ncbi:tetratricopeptide repeat protein [Streptosporangium sp. NPDC002721]|uniref:tetratricopeptide repeat protein n=1 Tax=Streptosporangium sp. NPDC002721 TaxID=3366188 RepID=UPI0036972E05
MNNGDENSGGSRRRPLLFIRSQPPPGPLRDLKDLLQELYLEAGAPTLDDIAERIAVDLPGPGAPGRDTVRRILALAEMPADQADLMAVVTVLARLARRDPLGVAVRGRELWRRARLASPAGLPIRSPADPFSPLADPFSLGVHRAIDAGTGPEVSDAEGDAQGKTRAGDAGGKARAGDLPAYVPRRHDDRLASVVRRAVAGHSAVAMLVGDSSTGKTRACWEAVRLLPGGWRLWHPADSGRPETILPALDSLAPRTVVWLDGAQSYLLTPADGTGERVAAGLRALVSDPERGPVLVLGTLWPEHWAALTSPPAASAAARTQARALVTGAAIHVPDRFTGPSLEAVHGAASGDPRLERAYAGARDGRIAQYLTGVPGMVERYRDAPAPARAVVEAAMDARRAGHGPALPRALLKTAAFDCLTDYEYGSLPPGWFEQALAYACGAPGLLSRVRPRRDEPSAYPRYRLAGCLEQLGHAERRTRPAPAALWDALVSHADPEDRPRLAAQARTRGLYHHALLLYGAAATAGDADAARQAIALLGETGRTEEALTWLRIHGGQDDAQVLAWSGAVLNAAGHRERAIGAYRRAAEAGNADAPRETVALLVGDGRAEEALSWLRAHDWFGDTGLPVWTAALLDRAGHHGEALAAYRHAARAGNIDAPEWLASLLYRTGHGQEAVAACRRAARTGDDHVLKQAVALLREMGRTEEAITWLRIRSGRGDTAALWEAVEVLRESGRIEEAITWLEPRVEKGDHRAISKTAELLQYAGRTEEAITWLTTRAETGDAYAYWRSIGLLRRTGQIEKAITLLRARAENGDHRALEEAVELLRETDRTGKAITWLYSRAESGDRPALALLPRLLEGAGRTTEAIAAHRRVAEAGNAGSLWSMAVLLHREGRREEAMAAYRRAVEAGHTGGGWRMVELLQETGRTEEALAAYRHAADAGDTDAGWRMVELLQRAGRAEEAITWLRARAENGDTDFLWKAVELLQESGRAEEAISWLRARAGAGDTGALRRFTTLLYQLDRSDEAVTWLRARAESGDTVALGHAVDLMYETGRAEEAVTWLDTRTEAGDIDALIWTAVLLCETGHPDRAVLAYLRAAELGVPGTLWRAIGLLGQLGRTGEADRLRRYGITPGRT